jgi:hypothetical protein
MMKPVAVFLYDFTGIMARPWADAGYICYCFDGQHPEGVSRSEHANIFNVGMWFGKDRTGVTIPADVDKVLGITGAQVEFLFAFPECTDLAVSGAGWFKKKKEANLYFQEEAMVLFYLAALLGERLGCKWGLENPVSVASTLWRRPDFRFNPYEYGGYLPTDDVHPVYPAYISPRDAYPKLTCIWTGGGFIEPKRLEVTVPPGYSAQHTKLGGKSLRTKNIRSATPRGFALATFESNKR